MSGGTKTQYLAHLKCFQLFENVQVGHSPGLVVLAPLHHDGVIAEGADQRRAVIPQRLGPALGHVLLHEGEVGSLLARSARVQHPGEGQLGMEAAEEAVERGCVGLLLRRVVRTGVRLQLISRLGGGRRVDRERRRVTGRRHLLLLARLRDRVRPDPVRQKYRLRVWELVRVGPRPGGFVRLPASASLRPHGRRRRRSH